jgi:hypothetical protein
MLTSATRAGSLGDDKWQLLEVVILAFDSCRNLAACFGAPDHDYAQAVLPSLLSHSEAMKQMSDTTDAKMTINSRAPMTLFPSVAPSSGRSLGML